MTAPLFDELIHAPARLRICAALAVAERASFPALAEATTLSDSALSKHLTTLAKAGYVQVTKTTYTGRLRTWVAMTRAGRRAYAGHLAALRALIDPTAPAPDAPEVQAGA